MRIVSMLICTMLLGNAGPHQALAQTDSAASATPLVPMQTSPPSSKDTTKVSCTRVALVSGGLLAFIASVHIYQSQGWWRDNRSAFHFQEDLKYGLSVDKLGHFYGATVGAFIFRKSLHWADVPDTPALWWGSGMSLMFQTYIEIEDGFSTWGFDRVDFASNVVGAAYPVAQHYWPVLRNINMKLSYHPSPLINEGGGIGFKGQKHIMFDDYEGQTIWLSVDVNTFLPKSVEHFWPDWLCLAVGYGARDIAKPDPYRVYFIALDFDATRIIPQDTAFLRTLSEAINFIHLPAPAVRISPGAIWYGLYF